MLPAPLKARLGVLGVLAAAVAPWVDASAADGALRLDTVGSARHYAFDSDWATERDWVFEETLQAALDSYLIDRAISTYHLGFALDHRTFLADTGRQSSVVDYRYDSRVRIWPEGDVPVTLWAHRQTFDGYQAAVPQFRAVSSGAGYAATVSPSSRLPRFQTDGYTQRTVTERDGEVQETRNSDLSAALFHTQSRLITRASVSRRLQERIELGRTNEQLQGDVFADYRFSSNTAVSMRARQQDFHTDSADSSVQLMRSSSDFDFRWEPSERLRSSTALRMQRATHDDVYSADTGVSTMWSLDPGAGTLLVARAGVEDLQIRDPSAEREEVRYTGEHVDGSASWGASSPRGSVKLSAQAGGAAVQDDLGTSGAQGAVGSRGQVTRSVAQNFVRLGAGLDGRRQWDTSSRDLDYVAYGWEGFMETRQVAGAQLHLRVSEAVVEQLSAEEGNSDLFELAARAGWDLSARVRLGYTMSLYRHIIDEEWLNGLAHVARVDVAAGRALTLSSHYYYRTYDQVDYTAVWSHRLDSQARLDLRPFDLSARYTLAWYGGEVPDTRSGYFWIELSRSFAWAL